MLYLYTIRLPKNRGLELPVLISMTSVEDFGSGFFIKQNNRLDKVRYRGDFAVVTQDGKISRRGRIMEFNS